MAVTNQGVGSSNLSGRATGRARIRQLGRPRERPYGRSWSLRRSVSVRPLWAEDVELDPDERGFLAALAFAALARLSCSGCRRIQLHRSIRSSICSRFFLLFMGATMRPDHVTRLKGQTTGSDANEGTIGPRRNITPVCSHCQSCIGAIDADLNL